MDKPDETEPAADNTQWGTWEELLLACAVNRYGARCWDSVAVEIRKRSSAPISLSPDNCKAKFLDLKRRYESGTDSGNGDGADDVPWLDELRKRRVEELKRELERYDMSIVSLQMKVKRLMEERDKGGEKADLGKCGEIAKNDEHEPAILSTEPEMVAVKQEYGGENQSVDESNENLQIGEVKVENETNPVGTADRSSEPQTGSPVRESSCNGSSDSKPVMEAVKVEPVGDVSESAGEGTKENSDVQSSASKSKKEGNDKLQCISRKSDEGERVDELCPGMKEKDAVLVKSQPLVDILQIVKSHKLGSVFERRLESQEKLRYKNTIRQHINLKMLQSRLNKGCYSDCNEKFFRDLLLFVNNALVFFTNKSPESIAAIDLRQLILKEMAKTKRNEPTNSSSEKQLTPPIQAPEQPESLLVKPQLTGSMIVCRKRSSVAPKAKEKQKATLAEENQVVDLKQPDKFSEEHRITSTKKRTRDAFPSSAKKNSKKVPLDTSTNKTSSKQSQAKGGSPGEHSETYKTDKKKNPIEADVKKQGATNFLNRMKSSSSSNNGDDDDSDNEMREDQKKGGNKRDGKKNQVLVPKKSSAGRKMEETDSPSKRSVGRQPKRAAAPLPTSSGKRSREVGDGEAVTPKQPRKRSRK